MDDLHADQEQPQRPGNEEELEAEEHRFTVPFVRTALAERVSSVERETERKEDEEREREGNGRETDDLPLAAKAPDTAQQPGAEEEREAEDEVADCAVDASGDERPHGEDERVVFGVVEETSGGRSRQHRGGSGEPDEQQDRLGARRDVVRILLAQREEHRLRTDEHGGDTQPPRAIR